MFAAVCIVVSVPLVTLWEMLVSLLPMRGGMGLLLPHLSFELHLLCFAVRIGVVLGLLVVVFMAVLLPFIVRVMSILVETPFSRGSSHQMVEVGFKPKI